MVVRIPPPSRPHNAKANTSDQNNASQVWTLNFRETAPALSNKTMYQHDPMASRVRRFGGGGTWGDTWITGST